MEQSVKKSSILGIFFMFLIVMGVIGSLFYVNLKKKATVTTEAQVTYVGNHYIVVEDDEGQEYSLDTAQDYNVGDKVSFTMKDIKKDSNPKEGIVEKIDTISKSVQFYIMDSKTGEGEENNSSSEEEDKIVENSTSLDVHEDTVVSYFENLNTNLDNYKDNTRLGESIKNGFVTGVDFLFYDGTIYGKTFDDLSTTAKLKVLKLAFTIDKKIEKYFPNYKEQISTTGSKIYTKVKAKVVESYLDITTEVCKNNSDTCQTAKEGLADLKTNFSLTWSFIKEISGVGVSKLKAWYEVWKTC